MLIALLAAGCDRSADPSTSEKSATPESDKALPAELFTDQPLEGAVGVLKARRKSPAVKPGERIVVRGRIGGRARPFVEGRAMFTLVDPGLKTCAENPDDACETPWDYCCEPAEEIAHHSATIQVTGPDGRVIKANLSGVGGLAPMSIVEVSGVVSPLSSDSSLVISADALSVRPLKPESK